MSVKKELQYSIYVILKHNKDGSFATQANRKKIAFQIAKCLVDAGYKLRHIKGLKIKHIKFLVDKWQNEELAIGTIKNRLACINWLCEKLGKKSISLTSAELNIPKRTYFQKINKSITLTDADLTKITDKNIQLSLRLQQQFGLRREEAMKIKPFLADKCSKLVLQGSWCKNGRSRIIPIRTVEQREILDECKQYIKNPNHSMIPKQRTYKQHLKVYEQQLCRAGIYKAHGLRHAYAQQRYKNLTGRNCPACNGMRIEDFRNEEMRKLDERARLIISEELGHTRIQIVAHYI